MLCFSEHLVIHLGCVNECSSTELRHGLFRMNGLILRMPLRNVRRQRAT